jgi:hypothetical protein
MRSSFASRGGFVLTKTPSHRQQVARRRLVVVGAVAAFALTSGLIGALTTRSAADHLGQPHTGPFSYFPTE